MFIFLLIVEVASFIEFELKRTETPRNTNSKYSTHCRNTWEDMQNSQNIIQKNSKNAKMAGTTTKMTTNRRKVKKNLTIK